MFDKDRENLPGEYQYAQEKIIRIKALILTNLFPKRENPNVGIFITKRLKEYKKLGVEFRAIPLAFEDSSKLAKFLRSVSGRIPEKPLEQSEGFFYEPVYVQRSLFNILIEKVQDKRKIVEKFTNLFVEKISKEIPKKYDVIHAHGMYLPAPSWIVAKKLSEIWKVPYVVNLHGSEVNIYMADKHIKNSCIDALESASKCIFVSKALLEKAKSFGYSGKNAVVIPNGYDPEIFKPMDKDTVRKELGIHREGQKYVGFVGNLIPIKRADKLGEIFSLIEKEIPETFFIVVGDGPLREKIEKETKDLNIIFTGRIPQTEVAKYMNAMDVMVLPSRNEGWPCVVLEAQVCGTCVIGIGSSNGGIPEAIDFEEYVVEEGENFEERFAGKIVEILKNGYDRDRLIQRARNFTWERTSQREIEVYYLCLST